MPQPHLNLGSIEQRSMFASALTERLGDRVGLIVIGREMLDFGVGHGVHALCQISDAIPIHDLAQLDCGVEFVSLGHGNIPHVVPEARDSQLLSVVPSTGCAPPCAHLSVNIRIRPVADNDLAPKPHPGSNESKLAVTMGRLIEIHEVHIDSGPGQFLIELRVQVH
jgi:hypothetical protein